MLKIIGSVLLIISGGLAGYAASRRLSLRVSFIEQYMQFINFLETQIRYSSCSLIRLISMYEQSKMLSPFLEYCAHLVSQGEEFSLAWQEALKNIPPSYGLKKEDLELINDFGMGLGNSDVEGQILHCKLSKDLADTRLKEAEESKSKKGKLYIILGFFSGLIIVLLFN